MPSDSAISASLSLYQLENNIERKAEYSLIENICMNLGPKQFFVASFP
jgi:hypothetical protein